MTTSTNNFVSPYLHSFQIDLSSGPGRRRMNAALDATIRLIFVALLFAVLAVVFSAKARAQSQLFATDNSVTTETIRTETTIPSVPIETAVPSDLIETSIPSVPIGPIYVRPTQRTKINNYIFDTFGPYPIAGAAITAGMNQFDNSPPEWKQGFTGYSKRFGSSYGMVGIGTTTRYALAQLFREDTLYYRCECTGAFPRFSHAVISTLTGRRGADGHRVFSMSSLVAPYAGSMTAVYGWYPKRFGVVDGLRLGSYSLLTYMGGNVVLEFLYSGPHTLIMRMHMNNAHGSPVPGPNL